MRKNLLFLLTLVCVSITASAQSVQPGHAEIRLAGLSDKVTVRRDARAIPYIDAKNDADLYFVQGYVTASDRLWQMDLLRRVARGETAELFGKQTLEQDKRWRRFGFAAVAEESLKYLDADLRSALENYARGVNAYIATLDDKTKPVEFQILQYSPREWMPADTVVIGKILAEALSSTYSGDLMRDAAKGIDKRKWDDLNNIVTPYDVVLFGKDTPRAAMETAISSSAAPDSSAMRALERDMQARRNSLEQVGLYAQELAASNNWVVSGKRTADGKPLLANDPHLAASAPGIWYMSHLSTPEMRVAGVTFPGVPGIVLGHNENIAWGATNVGPDVQDLYLETFDESGKYKTPSGWAEPKVRTEEVSYRASVLSPTLTSETIEVIETRNGPVIIDSGKRQYALKWTALDPRNSDFGAFYSLNRAKDWETFKRALSNYGGAMQNFIFADVKGNIGWYAAGRIPLRRTGDGSLPYDGSTSEGDWTGFVPFAELPHLYNPPQGFIVTANQRIVGTDYKYPQLVREIAPPWRARRLLELLSSDSKATPDSMTAAQHDVHNIPLKMFADDIVRLKAAGTEELQTIKDWDGRMLPDSQAALLVNEIRSCTANKIAAANPNVPSYLVRERLLHWAVKKGGEHWLPSEFADYGALLRSCSDSTVSTFSTRYGADRSSWVWGKVSAARFAHPLAAAPLIGGQFATPNTPISGSGQTPNVASNVSMRFIATPGNWDSTRLSIPLGQSGDPRSANYKDQFDIWSKGQPATFAFTNAAIADAAKAITVFVKP